MSEDIEAKIRFLTTTEGGRKTPVRSGYRPDHLVKENYLTCGRHTYPKEWVELGTTILGTIKFIDPESYPNSLSIGQKLSFQEGNKIVGYAEITRIYNKLLKKV
ncbi:hypothetical protein [Isobaculum melis]|uniref:Elongation factor Tu n=1 Tax=Isobaculum melis TaxID=142588 RepID=A0A1H9QSN8_9LACT|nr:hypothetical protein [Isobaculum melis]SER63484.1 elongation factor Tu [Isobaculum melis]